MFTCILFCRTHLGRIPTFGGQVLDLYALYNIVTSFGGISIVRNAYYITTYSRGFNSFHAWI